MNEGGPLRARAHRRVDVGGGLALIDRPTGGDARVIPAPRADALAACDRFRPLEEQVAALAHARGGDAAAIREELVELRRAGLLIDAEELRREAAATVAAGDPGAPRDDLRWLAIPTRGRPAHAARAAQSGLENARRHGRRLEVMVMDDTDDPAVVAELRARLRALCGDHGPVIAHGGRPEKERFIAAIDGIGGPAAAARFALTPASGPAACPGANRNAITLATLGDRLLSVDDDIVFDVAGAPTPAAGVRVHSGRGRAYENYNPAEFWFFADRQASLAGVRRVDVDAIGEHAACLGETMAATLARAGDDVELTELLDADMLDRLCDGRGRVRVTFFGTFGDIGWYAPTWLVILEGASRARLVDDPEVYLRSVSRSREVLRLVDRTTLNDGRYCQSAVIGLDNRAGVPPFIPMGRYEDGVFRYTLRRSDPDAYFAYLPYALLHDPLEARGFDRADIHRTGTWVRVGETLIQCLLAHEPTASAPAERLASFGAWLSELARAPLADLHRFLLTRLREQKGIYLEHFEEVLARHRGLPSAWADDLRAHIERTRASITRPEYAIPRELLAAEGDPDRALASFQRFIGEMGRLFREWGPLLEATLELRRRGVTPFTTP